MTNKEAIEILRQFKKCLSDVVFDEKGNEAWQMAIQALSQKPKYRMAYDYADGTVHKFAWIDGGWKEIAVEPYCDDAISREVARKALQNEIDKIRPPFDGWVGETMASLRAGVRLSRNIIEDLPSVTQKSGKWILLDECTNSGYYCSNCQKKLVKEGWSQTVKKIKYCPNCGAKMESEVRNEV